MHKIFLALVAVFAMSSAEATTQASSTASVLETTVVDLTPGDAIDAYVCTCGKGIDAPAITYTESILVVQGTDMHKISLPGFIQSFSDSFITDDGHVDSSAGSGRLAAAGAATGFGFDGGVETKALEFLEISPHTEFTVSGQLTSEATCDGSCARAVAFTSAGMFVWDGPGVGLEISEIRLPTSASGLPHHMVDSRPFSFTYANNSDRAETLSFGLGVTALTQNIVLSQVPEPATAASLLLGLSGLAAWSGAKRLHRHRVARHGAA